MMKYHKQIISILVISLFVLSFLSSSTYFSTPSGIPSNTPLAKDNIINDYLSLSASSTDSYVLDWEKDIDYSFGGVAVDSKDYVYFGGDDSGDYKLVKYNESGSLNWTTTRNYLSSDHAKGIVVDSEDNVYITGWSIVGSTEGGGTTVLIKYNSSGDFEWQSLWGSDSLIEDITVDDQDNIYIAGYTLEFGASETDKDMLIIKYDKLGDLKWIRRSGLIGHDYGYAIAYNDFSGLLCITGKHAGDMVLYMYDKNGNSIYTTHWDNGGSESGLDISVSPYMGRVHVVGYLGYAAVVFNTIGNYLFNITGPSQNVIAIDSTGEIFVSRDFSNYIYITKYDRDGVKLWDYNFYAYGHDPIRMELDSKKSIYILCYFGEIHKFKVDNESPVVNITSPGALESFGNFRPNVTVDISDPNLNSSWYGLSNETESTTNYTWTGTIQQNTWRNMTDGNIIISIYANDTNGNFAFDNVAIIKNSSLDFSWNLTNNGLVIDDSDPNMNWVKAEAENSWCTGFGTIQEQYIIKDLFINGSSSGGGIVIRNSKVFFEIKNVTLIDSASIVLDSTSNGTIIGNNITNGGISLGGSSNNVSNNKIIGGGISLSGTSNNVSNNEIVGSTGNGIYLGGTFNTVSNNKIVGSASNGIYLRGSSNNVSNNEIVGSIGNGIRSTYGDNNNITLNDIRLNDIGIIFLDDANDNILFKNEINNNYIYGVYIAGASRTQIINNSIGGNEKYGIVIRYYRNQTIINNTLFGNLLGCISRSYTNYHIYGMQL